MTALVLDRPALWVPPRIALPHRLERLLMSSRRMLLEPPQGPYRPTLPAIVQTATRRTPNPGADHIFPSATTVGSLLLYLVTRRQAAASAPGQETWTTLGTGQFQRTSDTTENGFGAYACICTVSRTQYDIFGTTQVLYEIAGSSLAGLTIPTPISDHASSTAVDLGSLGSPDATRLAFALFGFGPDLTSVTVTPGVWVRDFYAGRDADSGGTDTLNTAFPYSYYAHTTGTGAALEASVGLSVTQKYGGIAVLLA